MFARFKATPASKDATGSRKHVISVRTYDDPSVRLDTNWSGGSRSSYALLNAATGRRVALPDSAREHYVAWNACGSSVPAAWPIPAGFVILETGTFNGKPARPALEGRPEDVNLLLVAWGIDPASGEEV